MATAISSHEKWEESYKLDDIWDKVKWQIEWKMFKMPQKAEHEHASLFCDTEKGCAESRECDEDEWCTKWHDQS